MAETPIPELIFTGGCPDCGKRQISLPLPLLDLGDDFDWSARDYDSIRIAMLEELAARFPERTRWTPADIEVVIIEMLAVVLDQLFDMTDRVATEAYLETARRPESVRRLLKFIGFDAALHAGIEADSEEEVDSLTAEQKLEQRWREKPHDMERARRAGPLAVHNQYRMVTVNDYSNRLEEHPLVLRASAKQIWTGSWFSLHVAVILFDNKIKLDDKIDLTDEQNAVLQRFHNQKKLPALNKILQINGTETKDDGGIALTYRTILQMYIDAYRMTGQKVQLQDPIPVGIVFDLSVNIAQHYFQTEIRHEIEKVLSNDTGGFFEVGRMKFGEDIHASDLIEKVMILDGVENACLHKFKRYGSQYPDQAKSSYPTIVLKGLESAVCDNHPEQPSRGYYHLFLRGGLKG